MRHPGSLLPTVFPLLALALLSGGCSLGRQSPPTRLYVLAALPETDDSQRDAGTSGVALVAGPVDLPEYVGSGVLVQELISSDKHAL